MTPTKLDLARWAVVAYNDDTGLGRMAQDITAVLGLRQLVVASDRLDTRPLRPGVDALLSLTADESEIADLLAGVQGLVLLEKCWNPHLPVVARRLGVKIACVPMWEWFRGTDAEWGLVDTFLCPSALALNTVRGYGYTNAIQLPWTLDLSRFSPRAIAGRARVFFHNGGLMDHDDRKSTRDTIAAFRQLRPRDARLIVRMQKAADLGPLDDRIDVRVGNVTPVGALYAEGEVAVQPSTMEGIGFMVLEPVCCGVPTMTLDHGPMSDHVRQAELRVRKRWFKRSAFPNRGAAITHAHRRLPVVSDLTRKMAWCMAHDLAGVSRANRSFAEETFEPGRLREQWSRALSALL